MIIDEKQFEKFKMCIISFYMRVLDFISKLSSHYCLTNLKFEHKNANNKLCMKYKNVHQLSICIMRQIKGLHKANYFISIQFFISLIAQYLLEYIFLKLLSYIIR